MTLARVAAGINISLLPLREKRQIGNASLWRRENVVPAVTPFKRSRGSRLEIDVDGIARLLDHMHFLCKVSSLLVNGTTGEFIDQKNSFRMDVVDAFALAARGRFKLFANATGDTPDETEKNVNHFLRDVDGISAVVLAPLCYLTEQSEVVSHVRRIVSIMEGKLPLVLYSNDAIHRIIGSPIRPDTVEELAPLVAGMKDSSGDLQLLGKYAKHVEVGQGNEGQIVAGLHGGATFSVASIGNIVSWPQDIYTARSEEEMRSLQKKIIDARKPLTAYLNKIPGALKYCLYLLGICEETVAKEKNVLDDEERRAIEQILPEIVQSYSFGERADHKPDSVWDDHLSGVPIA
jgi:dihydrodipicolinate synthase/N-acetylneuraminate lyase